MSCKIVGFAIAAFLFAVQPVNAMVLSVVGGVDGTVSDEFDPEGFPGGVSAGDAIKIFNPGATGGLTVSTGAVLKYEYYGKEAEFVNFFSGVGDQFSTATSVVGDTIFAPAAAGLVSFTFSTLGSTDSATNGGTIDPNLSIAFAYLGDDSFLIMFNDGDNDIDRDDLVVKVSVSQVPLPAAGWLLLSAILGLFGFSRRTGKAKATAA